MHVPTLISRQVSSNTLTFWSHRITCIAWTRSVTHMKEVFYFNWRWSRTLQGHSYSVGIKSGPGISRVYFSTKKLGRHTWLSCMGEKINFLHLPVSSKTALAKWRAMFSSIHSGPRRGLNGSYLGHPCVQTDFYSRNCSDYNNFIFQSKLPLSLMRLKLRTNHKNQLRFHLANCLQGLGMLVCWKSRHSTSD